MLRLAVPAPGAQMRVVPLDDEQGHVALGLALRHLANAGIFMQATAHPDDENNGLLVMLNRGQGFRTALATATRGNGGQNEIGPEIFEALGVLRTEELAALHRFDGAEQYFTRAVDFGYSFSIDETFEKWGRDEIIGDYVRLIRTIRPDVITRRCRRRRRRRPAPSGVGASSRARRSSSPAIRRSIPSRSKEGLRPWQPKKFYFAGRFRRPGRATAAGRRKLPTVNLAVYDPLLGKTYAEIGTEARSMHKCQGMAQLLALPGPSAASYQLVESTIPGAAASGTSSRSSTASTRRSPGSRSSPAPRPPQELIDGLAAIASAVADRAEEVRRRRRRRDARAAARPACARCVRCAAQLRDDGDRRGRAVRDRFPPAPEGARVPAGHSARQRRPRRSAGRRRRRRAGTAGAACRWSSRIAARPT